MELESTADGATVLRFESTNGNPIYDWVQYRRNSKELYSELRRKLAVKIEEEGECQNAPQHFIEDLIQRLRDPETGLRLEEKTFLLMSTLR